MLDTIVRYFKQEKLKNEVTALTLLNHLVELPHCDTNSLLVAGTKSCP